MQAVWLPEVTFQRSNWRRITATKHTITRAWLHPDTVLITRPLWLQLLDAVPQRSVSTNPNHLLCICLLSGAERTLQFHLRGQEACARNRKWGHVVLNLVWFCSAFEKLYLSSWQMFIMSVKLVLVTESSHMNSDWDSSCELHSDFLSPDTLKGFRWFHGMLMLLAVWHNWWNIGV